MKNGTCEKCKKEKEVRDFYPDMKNQNDNSVIQLCDECSAKNPDAVLIKKKPDIVEFAPKPPAPIEPAAIPALKSAPAIKTVPKEQALEVHKNDLSKLEASKTKLAQEINKVNAEVREKGLTELVSKAKILPLQLEQVEKMIIAKKGAIAGIMGVE